MPKNAENLNAKENPDAMKVYASNNPKDAPLALLGSGSKFHGKAPDKDQPVVLVAQIKNPGQTPTVHSINAVVENGKDVEVTLAKGDVNTLTKKIPNSLLPKPPSLTSQFLRVNQPISNVYIFSAKPKEPQ